MTKTENKEFNLSETILFADSRDLVDLNSETSENKRKSGDLWTAELITIADVKEFIRLLKEFAISRKKNLDLNINNPRVDWKSAGIAEISNILTMLDKLAGDKLI